MVLVYVCHSTQAYVQVCAYVCSSSQVCEGICIGVCRYAQVCVIVYEVIDVCTGM